MEIVSGRGVTPAIDGVVHSSAAGESYVACSFPTHSRSRLRSNLGAASVLGRRRLPSPPPFVVPPPRRWAGPNGQPLSGVTFGFAHARSLPLMLGNSLLLRRILILRLLVCVALIPRLLGFVVVPSAAAHLLLWSGFVVIYLLRGSL